jgi:CHAD domain-containing protein
MITSPTANASRAGIGLLALLDTLEPAHANLDAEDVHRIRVAIKQTRAWLKLCRGMTGKTAAYHQLVENLRVLSAGLAGQRDRDVALQTLAKLARKYPGKKAQHLIEVLSQQLVMHQPPLPPALDEIVAQIRQGLLPFTQQAIPRATQIAVVNRSYTKMCQSGEAALASEACADLHAWRKQVKTLGYQLAMLDLAEPQLKKTIARLSKLGSKLGNIHDLCFLTTMIGETVAQAQLNLDLTPVLKRINKERKTLLETVGKHFQHVCKPLPHLSARD